MSSGSLCYFYSFLPYITSKIALGTLNKEGENGNMSKFLKSSAIRHTTASVESKLSTLITRIDVVEKRVEYLEAAEKEREANPLATKTDIHLLWEKIEHMENRSRHNNVRFIGIPEGKEGGDAVKFLEELLPDILDIEGKHEI